MFDFGQISLDRGAEVVNVAWPRDSTVRRSQTWYQKMRTQTWHHNVKRRVADTAAVHQVVAVIQVQGGVWRPHPD